MSNRRFLTLFLAILGLVALTCLIPGCKSDPPQPTTHQVTKHVVHVYHTEDGSTAYHGSDGFWYWYILYANTGSRSSSSYTPSLSSSPTGSWTRQTYAPWQADPARGKVVSDDEEDLQQLETETASELLEEPEQEQIEVTEPDAPEASPTTETEPMSEPASEPASEGSTDSGSSDSGGDSGSSD